MRYLVYAARDRHGPFYFVKREDEAPPEWPGLRLEIASVYADKDKAELALLEIVRWSAKAEEHAQRCRSAHSPTVVRTQGDHG